MNTYKTCKRVLENGNKNKVVTKEKLDVFLLVGSIDADQYKELVEMLNALENDIEESEE